jgi:hypothetical protein
MKTRTAVGVTLALLGMGGGAWALRAAESAPARSHVGRPAPAPLRAAFEARAGAAVRPSDHSDRVAALAAMAERDPAGATQQALLLSDAEGRLSALHESFPHWLARDREAAVAWLLLHVASMPLEAAEVLIRDSAALDPELALRVARQLAVGARPRGMREVFVQWAGSAPETAARAAEQLLEMDGQVRIIGEVARIWAERDPGAAQRWAEGLATTSLRREAELAIVQGWAERDPAQAAAALSKLPDEGYKQRLVDSVVSEWSARDARAARGWIEQLDSAELRRAGATALVASMLEREPTRAASWALELGGSVDSEVVEKTLTSWVARDPHAALEWAGAQSEAAGRAQLLALASARYRAQDARAADAWLTAHTNTGPER